MVPPVAWAGLSEAFMLGSAAAVVVGWSRIRRRQVAAHHRAMILAAALAVAFFVSYALRTVLIGDTSFGGPAGWRAAYQLFLQVHSTLATVAGVLGVITLRWALRGEYGRHRALAPWTASLWLIAAGSGLMVFLLLYVLYPPGPTASIIRALAH